VASRIANERKKGTESRGKNAKTAKRDKKAASAALSLYLSGRCAGAQSLF